MQNLLEHAYLQNIHVRFLQRRSFMFVVGVLAVGSANSLATSESRMG